MMRQVGKCDVCRQRKVKCDEKKPSCSSCYKGSRACKYSYPYGQGFTVVIEDPSQMTRNGKSIAASTVHALATSDESGRSCHSYSTPNSSLEDSPPDRPHLNDFHLRSGIITPNGQGIFQTLVPTKKKQRRISKKVGNFQTRRWQEHLLGLQAENVLTIHRPTSSESRLTAMFIDMLHPDCPQDLSLFCLGDWILSIPSRISSSPVVSIAAEFFVHCYNFYREQSYSNKTKALQTKGKALKELQLSLSESQQHPTYNLIVATKLHYSAEVLIGVDQMGYAVHALGLLDLLKSGIVSGVDQEHFWNVAESTYIDDITIAVTAGRPSVYDHDFYLSATHPDALSVRSLSPTQRVKMIMMHCLIQCPRLIVAIRHANRNRSDLVAIATAVTLADNLWKLSQQQLFADFVDNCLIETDDQIDDAVADIVPSGVRFNSVQNMVTCTKYWMLQILLCGCLDTLHRKFAHGFLCSNLPIPKKVHEMDTQAATQLGRAVLGLGDKVSPLTLLRAHGPLSFSIGAWHRQVRYLRSYGQTQSLEDKARIISATRMQRWILDKCNSVLERLHVSQADEIAWIEALDCMAGEELADWIPNKVSFGSEDGEIVMKLEYSDRPANGVRTAQSGGEVTRTVNIRDPANFGPQHLRNWVRGIGELPADENIIISYV